MYIKSRASKKVFKDLQKLGILDQGGNLNFTKNIKLKSSPFMNLNIDHLYNSDGCIIISIAHNFIQNGDVMSDPDMEIAISPELKEVYPLTYTLSSLGIYQRVYDGNRYIPKLKSELDRFLSSWTGTLINQGFKHIKNE